MNNIMETQDNFEQYFLNTFKQTFSELLMTLCLTIMKPELKTKLNKLKGLLETLDYKKIILDFSLNKNFQLWLSEYKKTDFMNDDILTKGDKKQWRIMPSFQIDEIMKCIELDKKLIVYKYCKKLFSCSIAFSKVVEQNEFIPSVGIENIASEFGINEMIGNNTYETPDSFNFVVENILSKWTDNDEGVKTTIQNLSENLDNIDKIKLDEASNNMRTLLKTETETNESLFLSSLIGSITEELKGINKDDKNLKGKDGMKKIYSIVSGIQEKIANDIDPDNINGLDLWRTATSFVKKTTGSDKIDIIHKFVEEQLVDKMNKNIEENIKLETEEYLKSIV